MTVTIDGRTLTGEQVARVARSHGGRFATAVHDGDGAHPDCTARTYIEANSCRRRAHSDVLLQHRRGSVQGPARA